MMNRMVGSVLTLMTLLFNAEVAVAQTYTQMQWGMNKATTPYGFGANINGTWRDLGTVSSAGVWGIPASNIPFTQYGAGAVATTVDTKLKQMVNVKDFGAKCDGVTDDTAAFEKAWKSLNGAAPGNGGVINIPRGTCLLNGGLVPTTLDPYGNANYEFKGAGQTGTILNCINIAYGKNCVDIASLVSVKISDLGIYNSQGVGLRIINSAFIDVNRVHVRGAIWDGVLIQNASYLINFVNVQSWGSHGYNFNVANAGTTWSCTGCYARAGLSDGFHINGLSYSVISASGSDINAGYGYYITNVSGLSIIGSGAEGNTKEAIKAEASSALDASALYKDVKGLSISSFLSVENGKGSSSYPSFASFTAANSKPVHVTLDGPTEFSLGAANTNSLTASGEGVLITENQKDFLAAESVSSGALTTGARPVAQTIASLPTCSADLLGITGLVSDGTAFATGTYGSAVSATGSVARAVVCTNTAGATTYAWAYN